MQQCQLVNFVIDDDYNFVIDDGDDDENSDSEPLLKQPRSPSNSGTPLDSAPSLSSPLRAVSSTRVLHEFAYVFAEHGKPQSESAANELYERSQDTQRVDHFVSHSWSAGRLPKWAAMADYYNRKSAVMIAYAWWLLASLIGVLWRLHTMSAMDFTLAYLLFTGIPGLILCFFAAFGNRLYPGLASQVFVDRICIHQWDDELKQQGIQGLGEVLTNSDRMMVLWSEDYFHRLWCIFEVATFSQDPSHMALLPLWATPFLYGMLVCNLMVLFLGAAMERSEYFAMLMEFWGLPSGIGMFWAICNLLPALVMCIMIRKGVVQKLAMERWVANFTLDETSVTVEEDRTYIYSQIRRVFGSLSDFETFVRHDMVVYLRAVIGPEWSFPYSWGSFVFQPYLWYLVVDAMSTTDEEVALQFPPSHNPGWLAYAVGQLFYYGFVFVTLPFALKAVALVAYYTLRLRSCVAVALDMIVFLSLVFFFTALAVFLWDLLLAHTVVLQQPPMTLSSEA